MRTCLCALFWLTCATILVLDSVMGQVGAAQSAEHHLTILRGAAATSCRALCKRCMASGRVGASACDKHVSTVYAHCGAVLQRSAAVQGQESQYLVQSLCYQMEPSRVRPTPYAPMSLLPRHNIVGLAGPAPRSTTHTCSMPRHTAYCRCPTKPRVPSIGSSTQWRLLAPPGDPPRSACAKDRQR